MGIGIFASFAITKSTAIITMCVFVYVYVHVYILDINHNFVILIHIANIFSILSFIQTIMIFAHLCTHACVWS